MATKSPAPQTPPGKESERLQGQIAELEQRLATLQNEGTTIAEEIATLTASANFDEPAVTRLRQRKATLLDTVTTLTERRGALDTQLQPALSLEGQARVVEIGAELERLSAR